MIKLFEQDIRTNDRQSSKGNQLKWKNGDTWYKADYAGYEGLTEYVVSGLLVKGSLPTEEFVLYDTEEISWHEQRFLGCRSKDFLSDGEQLITLERLFRSMTGESLYQAIFRIHERKDRLPFLIRQAERITGISGWDTYFAKMLTIDALFLNEDRHLHNVAVIMNSSGEFRFSPLFDHGAGLLSDISMDYPMSGDIYAMIDRVKAKTVSESFDEQLNMAESIAGQVLHFYFRREDVRRLLEEEPYYDSTVKERVRTILYDRMRKYRYLFNR